MGLNKTDAVFVTSQRDNFHNNVSWTKTCFIFSGRRRRLMLEISSKGDFYNFGPLALFLFIINAVEHNLVAVTPTNVSGLFTNRNSNRQKHSGAAQSRTSKAAAAQSEMKKQAKLQ